MDLSLFDYTFPKDLVAQHPLPDRDASRLMVVHRNTGTREHRRFPGLLNYLQPGDLLVMNNALADLIPMGEKLVPALPPYIKRKKVEDFSEEDYQRYKTIYGSEPGSKAAPTAGFHFSEHLLSKIRVMGVDTAFVTLHVSYDTYKPIRSQNILEHPMHGEDYVIPAETQEKVQKAKSEGRRVIAVGTTSVRVLESWATSSGPVPSNLFCPAGSNTCLYITPGYQFQIVDAMITNFHRPRSTVLVMVSAFAGRELMMKAYEEAIREKYRLFSYGDAMLIV